MEITYRLEDIDAIAYKLLESLHSRTILLNGAMGVGKTTFTKALVKALGSKDEVSSPTFSIVNEYELAECKLYHFDLYRIKDEAEALQFGIEDYLASNHWIVMEWSENIPGLIPEHADTIELKLNDDHSRTLKLKQTNNLTEINMAKNCTS